MGIKQAAPKFLYEEEAPDAYYRGLDEEAVLKRRYGDARTVATWDALIHAIKLSRWPVSLSFDDMFQKTLEVCRRLLRLHKVLVVCIDDPKYVSSKKSAEQRKRDRSMIEPTSTVDVSDDFLLKDDIRQYVSNRTTRYNVLDEIYKRIVATLDVEIAFTHYDSETRRALTDRSLGDSRRRRRQKRSRSERKR